MAELMAEIAPSGRSACRQCSKAIEKGEKRFRVTGQHRHGFVYCEACMDAFIEAWKQVVGFRQSVKEALQESVDPKVMRSIELFEE